MFAFEEMSTKNCHACLKRGQQSPVFSACYECREFYCNTCSGIHPTFKSTEGHTIYQLLLPAINPPVNNEDELASDFLKTDDEDPPYAAQVAVKSREGKGQSKLAALPRSDKKSSRQADPGNLKAEHCRNIDVKRSEDKYGVVHGVLTVAGQVVVVDNSNKMLLKLFNDSGVYLSSTALKDSTWGITRVSDDTFATCGHSNTVYIWNIHGQTVTRSDVTYRVQYDAYGIMYDGTYYCVLHSGHNTITILERQGQRIRHIKLEKAFGKEITLSWDIYMDEHSHNIYVPCWGDNLGVICMSVQGEPLWFTPVSSGLYGITEIRGVLCVADFSDRCLHLLSKAGKYEGKLMERKDLGGEPWYIYYDGQREKLYVSYNPFSDKDDVISMYSVTC